MLQVPKPLFGKRSSVTDVCDTFGPTLERSLTNNSTTAVESAVDSGLDSGPLSFSTFSFPTNTATDKDKDTATVQPLSITQHHALTDLINSAAFHSYEDDDDDDDSLDTAFETGSPLTPTHPSLTSFEQKSHDKIGSSNSSHSHHYSLGLSQLNHHDDQVASRLNASAVEVLQDAGRVDLDRLFDKHHADQGHRHSSSDHSSTHTVDSVSVEDAQTILESLFKEFGQYPDARPDHPPERFIARVPAVLFKTVLIKGILLLTSRRLCFLACIPQHSQTDNPILKSGPVTVHRPGMMSRKHAVWLQLCADSISYYPSSSKLYRPLDTFRLSENSQLLRIDWNKPKVVRFVDTHKSVAFEFKTEEAAMDWRSEIEAVMFRFRSSSGKVRISIPLERITNLGLFPCLQVANFFHVQILDSRHDDAAVHHSNHAHDPATHMVTNPPPSSSKVTFAVMLHRSSAFERQFRLALQEPLQWRTEVGDLQAQTIIPEPIIDIATSPRNGDTDAEHTDDHDHDHADDHVNTGSTKLASRFCRAFALPARPDELKIVKADVVKTLPCHGTLAIGLDFLCFWRRGAIATEMRLKIPLNDIHAVNTHRAFRWHFYGLLVHITAHSDLLIEFPSRANRDMVLEILQNVVASKKPINSSSNNQSVQATTTTTSHALPPTPLTDIASLDTAAETIGSQMAKVGLEQTHNNNNNNNNSGLENCPLVGTALEEDIPLFDSDLIKFIPKLVNFPSAGRKTLRIKPMRIYCLTIGSRGDVQPYIALCKGLIQHGHTTVIVSHPEYREWVESHGIEFRGVGGDPGALMKLSVEHRIFSPAFFRESVGKFRIWLDELLRECWEQCQGAELLIESPSTMAGIHVAEGLDIPYFRAFTMPWTKTSAYPQAFSVPPIDMGAPYNSSSYVLFDQMFWMATSGQINRWRKYMLGLAPTDLTKLQADQVPFIYNFSPAVVSVPIDWGDRINVSGYWFLDNPDTKWTPPTALLEFLTKARNDGKKLVYIGFGSITIENSDQVAQNICQAVQDADVRAIVAKGWSGRMNTTESKKEKNIKKSSTFCRHIHNRHDSEPITTYNDDKDDNNEDEDTEEELQIPEQVFVVDSIPHDWLFPQIDIAMHHGGAGTTGASLRAGLVTLIKPFFGDQFFWALRVQKLGVGCKVNNLTSQSICEALKVAANDRIMVEKAKNVGTKIQSENGIETAIEFLYKNLSLAKTRSQRRPYKKVTGSTLDLSNTTTTIIDNSNNDTMTDSILGLNRFSSPKSDDYSPSSPTIIDSPPISPSTTTSSSSRFSSVLNNVIRLANHTNNNNKPIATRSFTTTTILNESIDETEQERNHRLKGFKNAKIEDIRRRILLEQKLSLGTHKTLP